MDTSNLSTFFALRSWLPAIARIASLLLAVAGIAHAWDGSAPVRFQRIGVEQGLSQSMVYSILQDSRGYMWFGTRDGLNRYDGYSFIRYMHQPYARNSMPSGVIRTVREDAAGRLWIGTLRGGLVWFNTRRDTFISFRQDQRDPTSLNDDNVTALCIDSSGTLWAGGLNGGISMLENVARYDGRGPVRFRRFVNDPHDSTSLPSGVIHSITEGPGGEVWIAAEAGVCRFNRATGTFHRYPGSPDTSAPSPVYAVMVDHKGTLWIGSGTGLSYLDRTTGRVRMRIPAGIVGSIVEDDAGVLWFASTGGLHAYDPVNGTHRVFRHDPHDPGSLSSTVILSVGRDRSGGIWVGAEKGLHRVDYAASRFRHYIADSSVFSLPDGLDIRSLYEDSSGMLWVGTSGQGLLEVDRKTAAVRAYRRQQYPNDGADYISTIYEDHTGRLWVGTREGIGLVDRHAGKTVLMNNEFNIPVGMGMNVWSIQEDREGMLWVGTVSGLMRVDPSQRRAQRISYAEGEAAKSIYNSVWIIHQDRRGDLWLGTPVGLFHRNQATGKFRRYHHDPDNPTSISHNEVWYIHEDHSGALWIGTWGGGLNRFDRVSGTFSHYTDREGLPSNVIHGILEDSSGAFWISSGRGVFRLDPASGAISRFDRSDGLQGDEFNPKACLRARDGEMFFGGPNGLNGFFPERMVSVRSFDPPIVITSHRRLDSLVIRELLDSETVEIGRNENSFSFEFTALAYTGSGKIRYAYMLEGFDHDWVQAGTRRYATYTNLAPGEYRFRVRTISSDGAWSGHETLVHVTVIPSFWNTWRFRGLALACACALGLVWYRVRKRRSRELQAALEEAREIERRGIATELHDGPLQDLYGTRFPLDRLHDTLGNEKDRADVDKVLTTLADVRNSLRNVCGDLQMSDLQQGLGAALYGHAAYLREHVPGIRVHFALEGDEEKLPVGIARNLFRVYRTAINNVIKHAGAMNVWTDLTIGDGWAELVVRDDGCGFEPPQKPADFVREKHYGLLLAESHVRSMGGRLNIISRPGRGTTVRVMVEWRRSFLLWLLHRFESRSGVRVPPANLG